ncbi:MAG: integration host factor subunit beta [Verrucomicrobia bacterium]|nr:integration host factor subunit beta [Verrucomicrobiota bacterium]
MTKRDLVVRISEETGFPQRQVYHIAQKILDSIAEALARDETVEFRNFGVFEVVVRRPRVGRNPNVPRSEVQIPPRAVVKFKAGKRLAERVARLTERKTGGADSAQGNGGATETARSQPVQSE